jgi:small-conductance mechanosensitive channel
MRTRPAPAPAVLFTRTLLLVFTAWLGLTTPAAAQDPAVDPKTPTESVQPTGQAGPALEAPPVLDEPVADTIADKRNTGGETTATQIDPGDEPAERWTVTWIFLTIWNAELFSAGGSPIVLNQLVLALLIILLGIWISKRVARLVRFRLSKIQRIDSHAAAVVQTIVFNTLVVIIVLAAMPIAGIPTTIFTVLGGAVAIGIGFGAQNLFNNLISGLIIMLERPIRLGDIVQAGEHEGTVDAINNRCTHIRRSDGVDVLVPNSHFLEQPVINWTLSNKTVRGSVVVGVAYGSPTDTVARLLRQAVDEHTLIHDRPEPIVLFQDFGDNALSFEVYFWANIRRPMDLRKIQSDVRFRVDEICREKGIAIAYPQRDVHLDTLKPLDVRVVQAGDAGV